MQSFPKGPTIPSLKNLVSSVSKTEPEIVENFFGDWVLGRDHLSTSKPEYEGILSYSSARFSEGLNFEDGVSVRIPAQSNMSLDEGSISTWIKPNWNGIENDAIISFDFENFGDHFFEYSLSKYMLDQLEALNFEDIYGSFESGKKYLSIVNYDIQKETELYSYFGAYYKYDIKGAKKYKLEKDFNIDISRLNLHLDESPKTLNKYSKDIELFSTFINDGAKIFLSEVKFKKLSDEIIAKNIKYDHVSEFKTEVDCLGETITVNYSDFLEIEEKGIFVELDNEISIDELIKDHKASKAEFFAILKLEKFLKYSDSLIKIKKVFYQIRIRLSFYFYLSIQKTLQKTNMITAIYLR